MTATIAQAKPKTFRLRVANRNTITLPAELREQLGLKPGDGVEITLNGPQALLEKAPHQESVDRAPDAEILPAKGLLRDYFTDRDDVRRFLEEERRGLS